MRQCARRLALIAGLVAALLAVACGEAMAQVSRIYEFGADATELFPRRVTGKATRPPSSSSGRGRR